MGNLLSLMAPPFIKFAFVGEWAFLRTAAPYFLKRKLYFWFSMAFVFRFICLSVLLCCFGASSVWAVVMKGKVYDAKTRRPIENVSIINTFTEESFITDSTGEFSLKAENGHLVEFRKLGYQVVRVRVHGNELPFYSIAMTEGPYELQEVEIRGHNYRTDSVEMRETYKWAIDHYTLSGVDIIAHPFDALSKRNRQIWAFQKHYQYFEQEKFIDYVFNDKLVNKLTGLEGELLQEYKRKYRPSYRQIQAWSDYDFYAYIKRTGIDFKSRGSSDRD